MAAIEVRGMNLTYRQGQANAVHALDAISLSVQSGEFVSLVGRAGSGKTSFLHCAGMLLRRTSGQVLIDGIDTGALTDAERADLRGRRLGFVFRDRNLLPTLTVLQNVLLPLRYTGLLGAGKAGKKRARDLLELVGLADRTHDLPAGLTVGQAQRAAIARSLVRAPSLVLADEPTGEVDNETSDELLYLMQQLNRMSDVTFIVATHDAEIGSCMDRMIRISDGQVVADARLRVDRQRLPGIR